MGEEIAVTADEKALVAAAQGDIEAAADGDLQIPILKVTQERTNEVRAGDARPGQFVNSLTGEAFDGPVEFIVAGFDKGRFRTNKEGEVVCTGREGACGCHGVPYSECVDSEEQFRAAVKRGDREWDKGPPCATTYNFTGYVLGHDMPVRLSLMRMGAKPAKKLVTLLRFSKAPWDRVYELDIREQRKGQYDFHAVNVRQGRAATPEERNAAVNLAQMLRHRAVDVVGEEGVSDTAGDGPKPDKDDTAIDY